MVQTINWIPPTNNNVGSVLIYRAADNVADFNDIRTIIDTIDAKSGDDWVTVYTDTSGETYNYYRVQFWDGVGSSQLSDPISQDFSEVLATIDEVKQIADIGANSDIGSGEVYQAIKDASDEIYEDYGDPVRLVEGTVSSTGDNSYPGSLVIQMSPDRTPIQQVREVLVKSTNTEQVSGSSYTIDYNQGWITLTQAFFDLYGGESIKIEYVPKIFNLLCKTKAALQIMDTSTIIDGEETTSPKTKQLMNRVRKYTEQIRPKGVFGSTQL